LDGGLDLCFIPAEDGDLGSLLKQVLGKSTGQHTCGSGDGNDFSLDIE